MKQKCAPKQEKTKHSCKYQVSRDEECIGNFFFVFVLKCYKVCGLTNCEIKVKVAPNRLTFAYYLSFMTSLSWKEHFHKSKLFECVTRRIGKVYHHIFVSRLHFINICLYRVTQTHSASSVHFEMKCLVSTYIKWN